MKKELNKKVKPRINKMTLRFAFLLVFTIVLLIGLYVKLNNHNSERDDKNTDTYNEIINSSHENKVTGIPVYVYANTLMWVGVGLAIFMMVLGVIKLLRNAGMV
jgi:uncharacterized membrane protein